MPKEVTIKLPDGTIIRIPSGDTESLKTTLALVTGKSDGSGPAEEEREQQKVTSINDLLGASKIERIASIIRNHYPEGDRFISNEVCELYEIIFREGVKMSTVSTYLSRLADEKMLNRKGSVSQRLYSVTKKLLENYGELKVLEIPADLLK
ncbi:MAG: hypothetical protein ACTSSN_03050 [Candidatus Heimdallarchaeaceae archaeon]